ncbi:MAG TPA: proton-conducting transporter membrane subunit [Terriglobales bacterium]|nr:proton-conducting transporter membrane subunit [Terriglobales bacterium]
MNDLIVAALLLVPLLGGLAAWLLHGRAVKLVAYASMFLVCSVGLGLAVAVFRTGRVVAFGGVISIDDLGAYLLILTVLVAATALAASPRYISHELTAGKLRPRDEGHYYALFLWFVGTLVAVPLVDNLGLLWVAIEATTVVSALLVGINRSPDAIEAAWKYLILGTIGVGFALLATLLAYASSVRVLGESSDALNWTTLMTIAPQLNPNLLRLSFVFALAGYGTKMGLAPFHTWLPDAHSQAPSPISALLSGVSLIAAFYALVRFHLVAAAGLGSAFSSNLLIFFGLLSIAVALPFLIRQEDVKRLLAYSSVEHMGVLALGLGFGGPLALLGVVAHMGFHALTKATLFISAGELVQQYGSRRLSAIRGTMTASPVAGGALGSGIVLLGGLPPSGLFVTEFAIIVGGVTRGYGLAAALAALLLALCFVALAVHGSRIVWGHSGPVDAARALDWSMALRLALPLAAVAVLGLWTPDALASTFESVRSVLAVIGA